MEEEEEEIMDYHSMKRKQLQALCKRHGVPANLSNSEMADLLCLIFKEKQKFVSRGKSSLKNSAKKVNGKDSKVVKKVRFSPENQTVFYEVSGYKRAGRRRVSMKSLSKNQNQAIESEVWSPPHAGRKRARRDKKKSTAELSVKSAADNDGNAVRGVIVGEDSKLEKLKTGGRITRSRAQFIAEASDNGEVYQLEEPCKVVGRAALTGKSAVTRKGGIGKESLPVDSAESDRVLQYKKGKDEGSEMLPENSEVRRFSRSTRSQAKPQVAVSDAESDNKEVTIQLEELVRSLGRYASRRKSVVVQTGKVGSEGLGVKKEISKRSRSIDLEESSKLEAIIEPSQELEKVKNVVIPSGPSRRTRRNKSIVPSDGELETCQTFGQTDARLTKKLPRRSGRNVVQVAEPDGVLKQKELDVFTKDEDSEILSRKTRKFKSVNRITSSQTEIAGKVSAFESESEEENVQLEEPPKGLDRIATRRKSVVQQTSMVENEEIQEKKETRKRSSNTDLERASEAVIEPTKEIEMVSNVTNLCGSSRRTRRKTVMFKSNASVDAELETRQLVGQEDAYFIKDHTSRSSRNASRNQSTVISSEVGGVSHDLGKIRQQKRRQEPAPDEDISVTKSKPLEEKPQRRSARNASKNDLVEPARSTGKVAGKKHQNRRRKTMVVQEVPSSHKVLYPEDPIIEDARLVGTESARNKDSLDASSSKQVLESSGKKRKTSQMKVKANKKLGSIQISTVNSVTEKAVDTAVNSEETLDSSLIKQLDVPTDQITLNSASSSMLVLENQCSLVGDDKIEPLLDETLEVDTHEKNNYFGNVIASEITSPAVGLSRVNQSNDLAEPSNIIDLEKVLEDEEPSIGKNINHGSNTEADHSNKDDRASVQECQNLVQLEDEEETSAAPDIQEAVFQEHLDELSRSNSEKKSELPQEAEEINVIDPSDEGGNSHSENFLQAIEIQELPVESHLVTIETATERTTEIQLTSPVASATEATSCKPASENEVFEEVNNSPAESLIASNDAMEEVNKAETQSVSLLTVLEISNENGIQTELSGKGIESSDEIICRGETSIGNAFCGLAKTEDGATSNKNELDEAVHNERASQVEEKSINDGCEENLLVGGSSIFKTPGNDDTNKVHEVSTRYSVDAVEKKTEDSKKNSGNVSLEIKQKCTLELSDAKEVNLTIMEERAPARAPAPGTADKVNFPELALLKSNDELGKVSSSGTKSSSSKGKHSVHNDIPEKLNEKLNGDAGNVLKTKVLAEFLPHFALEELQEEADRRDANSTSGKVYDFGKSAELQVSADGSSCRTSPLDKSGAASGSELDPREFFDYADLIGERSCTVDIVVKQTADVVKEEKAESEIEVELADISDQENAASQVNVTASTSLTEIISKECEVPDEKAVEITEKPAERSGVCDMKVEEFKADNANSNAEHIDVGALAQVASNHLVEEEATERDIEIIGIAAEERTETVVMDRIDFSDADNGETSIQISPVTGMTFKFKFEDISDPAPGSVNEVTSANSKDVEIRSNGFVSTVPHIDEVKFGDLDNYKEEKVLELERSASVTSDKLMSMNDRAADKKANPGDIDGNSNFKDNQLEDNVDTISQVTKDNTNDCLLQVGLRNAGANIEVADDAGEVSNYEKACSQNIEDGNEWVKTPNLSQTIKNGWDEKNSAQGKFSDDTSICKPEMGSRTATASHLSVLPFPGIEATDMGLRFEIDDQAKKKTSLTHEEDKEGSNDSLEDNASAGNEQLDDHKGALLGTASIDEIDTSTSKEPSCSNRQKNIVKVGEEGVPSEELSDMIVTADTEKLYPVSSSTPRMTADCSAFSPIIVHSNYGITENKSSEFHIDSPRLTSWEMNRIFGSRDQVDVEEEAGTISEANLMTHYCQDAMEMKENLVTDEEDTERQIGDLEHHTHLAVLDEPICDNEESREQNNLSASKQENIAYIDESKPEKASVLSKEAENIVVDPSVFNCSRSRVAMHIFHTEASKIIDMLQEDEHLGTMQPVEDSENTKEASEEIAETNFQHMLSSGKATYEVYGEEYSNGAERPELFNEDRDKSYRDVREDEAAAGKCDGTYSFSVVNNVRDSQEVVEDQFDENELAATNDEAPSDDGLCLALNRPSYDNKITVHAVETGEDGFRCAEDSNELVNLQNMDVASTLIPEIAVDRSTVSPPTAFSKYVIAEESDIFTSREMNLFSGPGEQDETENSDAEASETNSISEDAREVKENEITIGQVAAPQVTEEHLHEYEMAGEDLNDPSCESGKVSTEQEDEPAVIHGTPNGKNCENEPLKLENTNSSPARETAPRDAWRRELNLLSPQNESPDTKVGSKTLFAKKLNSLVSKSALIQKTQKLPLHDMKENALSTVRGKAGNVTAQKSALSKRRALGDLQRK